VKFKIDENLPAEAATVFRQAGYDADTVWDEALAGADDATVVGKVRREHRILVTLDLDFANIRSYPPEAQPGLIVLRLTQQDKANAVAVLKRVVLALGQRTPEGELWIVEEDRIRFRQGQAPR
jgi:predicted nuclease of predicted toxin-antitoxin system